MSSVRRFHVAPALVRLIRKERGSARVLEGYFPPQGGRTSFVRVEGAQCHLVLLTIDAGGRAGAEERTEVPRAHGDALLDVCAGKAVYERTQIALGGGRDASVDRYSAPGALDLVSVAFDTQDEAEGFAPPLWFGAEVTQEEAYEGRSLALGGVPATGEVALSNAALEAVLDLVEHRFAFGRYAGAPAAPRSAAPAGPSLPPAAPLSLPAQAPAGPSVQGSSPTQGVPSTPAAAPGAPTSPPPGAPSGAPSGGSSASPPGAAPAPAATEADVMSALRRLAVGGTGGGPSDAAVPEAEPMPEDAAARTTDEEPADARIDDVIESLSQALGAAVPTGGDSKLEAPSPFERWTIRPRRQG